MVSPPRSRVIWMMLLPRSGKRRASAIARRINPIHSLVKASRRNATPMLLRRSLIVGDMRCCPASGDALCVGERQRGRPPWLLFRHRPGRSEKAETSQHRSVSRCCANLQAANRSSAHLRRLASALCAVCPTLWFAKRSGGLMFDAWGQTASNEKMCFQSAFMLTICHPLFRASSKSSWVNVPTLVSGNPSAGP
jgi:hypothetical protein